jgi:hypothetical protein
VQDLQAKYRLTPFIPCACPSVHLMPHSISNGLIPECFDSA